MDTVYDTTVVACANGDLAGRRPGNKLDTRLSVLEEFLEGLRVAWYNKKLLDEYSAHLRRCRNDVTEAFLRRLGDVGKRAPKSSLARQHSAKARTFGWPSHDQHLLAAALAGTNATIFVTERRLANCARGARRLFGVNVVRV